MGPGERNRGQKLVTYVFTSKGSKHFFTFIFVTKKTHINQDITSFTEFLPIRAHTILMLQLTHVNPSALCMPGTYLQGRYHTHTFTY